MVTKRTRSETRTVKCPRCGVSVQLVVTRESAGPVPAAAFLLATIAYVSVSLFAYSWRNPELTSMQVLRHVGDAVLWR